MRVFVKSMSTLAVALVTMAPLSFAQQAQGNIAPASAAAGRRGGQMIKTAARADTDQLLFAVVDAAVRKVGTPLAPASGQ